MEILESVRIIFAKFFSATLVSGKKLTILTFSHKLKGGEDLGEWGCQTNDENLCNLAQFFLQLK